MYCWFDLMKNTLPEKNPCVFLVNQNISFGQQTSSEDVCCNKRNLKLNIFESLRHTLYYIAFNRNFCYVLNQNIINICNWDQLGWPCSTLDKMRGDILKLRYWLPTLACSRQLYHKTIQWVYKLAWDLSSSKLN